MEALEARIDAIFADGRLRSPDTLARQQLQRLWLVWPCAASYVVDELAINKGGKHVAYVAAADGQCDESGYTKYVVQPRDEPQGFFNSSGAMMKIIKRWQDQRLKLSQSVTDVSPPKRARQEAEVGGCKRVADDRSRDARRAPLDQRQNMQPAPLPPAPLPPAPLQPAPLPPAPLPPAPLPPAPLQPPQQQHSNLNLQHLQAPEQHPLPPPIESLPPPITERSSSDARFSLYDDDEIDASQWLAAAEAAESRCARATDAASKITPMVEQRLLATEQEMVADILVKASFDVRFRLYAVGADALFAERLPELRQLVEELNDAVSRDCSADAKNAIGARHGLGLGYFPLAAHSTLIYQITYPIEGERRYDLPIEIGTSLAHRRLGTNLLRVRFESPPKSAPPETKARCEARRQQVFDSGIPHVAGDRLYAHFCHKDADKPECQLWFVHVEPTQRDGSRRQARWVSLMRQQLLDPLGTTDGHQARLSISKLNARLCLAFSSALSAPSCAPNVERVLDLRSTSTGNRGSSDLDPERGTDGRESSQWERLAKLDPLPPGTVQLVIVDDLRGDTDDGSAGAVMTDGAGLLSFNLAQSLPLCTSGRPIDRAALGAAPLLAQVRVWHRGHVAKGMLMTDSTLPDGYIVVRESMVKVFGRAEADLNRPSFQLIYRCATDRSERSAFEVLRTSNGAPTAKMNPQLVPLLEHASGPPNSAARQRMVALLTTLAEESKRRVCELDSDDLSGPQLRSLLTDFGLRETSIAAYMLLAGFRPKREAYLQRKVGAIKRSQLEQIASGPPPIDTPMTTRDPHPETPRRTPHPLLRPYPPPESGWVCRQVQAAGLALLDRGPRSYGHRGGGQGGDCGRGQIHRREAPPLPLPRHPPRRCVCPAASPSAAAHPRPAHAASGRMHAVEPRLIFHRLPSPSIAFHRLPSKPGSLASSTGVRGAGAQGGERDPLGGSALVVARCEPGAAERHPLLCARDARSRRHALRGRLRWRRVRGHASLR